MVKIHFVKFFLEKNFLFFDSFSKKEILLSVPMNLINVLERIERKIKDLILKECDVEYIGVRTTGRAGRTDRHTLDMNGEWL